MPPLPVISGRDAAKAFEKIGFFVPPSEGQSLIYYRPDGRHLSIPDHRELNRGTLRGLIRGAGITVEEFIGLL
jgi:predicted RNA binding protein YcfA (HicA-like mRNA interferase family)